MRDRTEILCKFGCELERGRRWRLAALRAEAAATVAFLPSPALGNKRTLEKDPIRALVLSIAFLKFRENRLRSVRERSNETFVPTAQSRMQLNGVSCRRSIDQYNKNMQGTRSLPKQPPNAEAQGFFFKA